MSLKRGIALLSVLVCLFMFFNHAYAQTRQVDVQANQARLTELVKNLELAKISLRKQTPLRQIIDRPIYPLTKKATSKTQSNLIGGFSKSSRKRRSYVIYANGSVNSTYKFLFFNKYRKEEPGSELFVPNKDVMQKLSAQELLGITTGIASFGAIILGILNLSAK